MFKVQSGTPLCYTKSMSNRDYLGDLRRRSPNHPNYKIEARAYKNAKGVDELIHLQVGYWSYVEWLEANTDIRFGDWVIHCDQNPFEDWPLSKLLMYWLWKDQCGRFAEGERNDQPFPPMGYEGWADEFHSQVE